MGIKLKRQGIKTINKETLGYVINDLMKLSAGKNQNRRGTSYDIVRIIVNVMRDALLRGETVRINGFGRLRIRERGPMQREIHHFHGLTKNRPRSLISIPAKKYIYFEPSEALIHMLNEEVIS